MKGITLFRGPASFKTFELAHRMESKEHYFEVSYGSSFSELYYEFTPATFQVSADRNELLFQFNRAGIRWLPEVLMQLAAGTAQYTTARLLALANGSAEG
jgi:hypothetical protein